MAVKRYDGSAWQVVAGKGDQGTSSSISTWVKTASGGETSLSGNDDNSQSLSYTVGQELVFINGTLLKRGSDYTATNGTSITGLTALAANDVATVWTVNAFSVTGAIANTIVDAKGDLLVGTAADTPGRLAVGTDGQVLTAASTTGTGLTWATPAGSDLVLITTQAFTSSSAVNVNNVFTSTYNNYRVLVNVTGTSTANDVDLRLRASGSDNTNASYQYTGLNTYSDIDTVYTMRNNGTTAFARAGGSGEDSADNGATNMVWEFFNPQASLRTGVTYHVISSDGSRVIYDSGSGIFDNTTSFDGFSLIVSTGNITGKVYVYGYKV